MCFGEGDARSGFWAPREQDSVVHLPSPDKARTVAHVYVRLIRPGGRHGALRVPLSSWSAHALGGGCATASARSSRSFSVP